MHRDFLYSVKHRDVVLVAFLALKIIQRLGFAFKQTRLVCLLPERGAGLRVFLVEEPRAGVGLLAFLSTIFELVILVVIVRVRPLAI